MRTKAPPFVGKDRLVGKDLSELFRNEMDPGIVDIKYVFFGIKLHKTLY